MSKKGYSELSKDAVYLLSRAEFEKQKVITTEYAVKILGNYRKATSMLDSLSQRNRLIQLKRGRYLIVPLKAPNQLWMPNEYVVASLWMDKIPYYIGYSTMYNYWGFTEQIPQSVTVLNTLREWKRNIKNIRYVAIKISPRRMYGIKKIRIDEEEISISDKERTLVDFISNPMGSWGNVQSVINDQVNSIDLQKFVRYLMKYPVVAVRKRAGLMLERAGVSFKDLIQLKQSIGSKTTYVNFNPFIKSRKGKINQDWKLIINGPE
jgi:predicted transcriptional regulator of viral defense system